MDARRALPGVGTLLEDAGISALLEFFPRSVVVDAVRDVVDSVRSGMVAAPADSASWAQLVESNVKARSAPSLRPVFNCTGVVLHTNLGRAPLAAAAIERLSEVASGYSTLEYQLADGTRGSRNTHGVDLLGKLTGAEDAMVVNNCASALVLAVATVARGREVVVSRGELIEIGGSFRIPEILAQSGATIHEVGTTNRTHLSDYADAISAQTGALLKVHRSNFAMQGFTSEASVQQLSALSAEHELPLLFDFGSGLMLDLSDFGLQGEPTTADTISWGADIVLLSGDKLLGGPQCGIILGGAKVLAAMKQHPLARALRVDKLTLAALQATLELYLEPARALLEIPTLRHLTESANEVGVRAADLAQLLKQSGIACSVVDSVATVGGGAFPTSEIESRAVVLDGNAERIEGSVRRGSIPVIGRIHRGQFILDCRCISPMDVPAVATILRQCLSGGGQL